MSVQTSTFTILTPHLTRHKTDTHRQLLCPRSKWLLTALLTLLHTVYLTGREIHKFCNKPLMRGKTNIRSSFFSHHTSLNLHMTSVSNEIYKMCTASFFHAHCCKSHKTSYNPPYCKSVIPPLHHGYRHL